MEIITEIESVVYPVNIRFGVGIGKITTEINRELSIGADGSGYMIVNGESQVDAARRLGAIFISFHVPGISTSQPVEL